MNKNVAVIVENRPINGLSEIIAEHMQFLCGWELLHITDAPVKSRNDFSLLLTDSAFWQPLVKFERVLMFQHDSRLLRHGIEAFLKFDYVGAPWRKSHPWAHPLMVGGNGGLSLRNPRACLHATKQFTYWPEGYQEDVFFVHALHELGYDVAPFSVCKTFSCESVFAVGTLGYHNPQAFMTRSQVQILKHQYDTTKK